MVRAPLLEGVTTVVGSVEISAITLDEDRSKSNSGMGISALRLGMRQG
jgi:hypothetical protein